MIHSGEGEVRVDGVTRFLSVGQVFRFRPGCHEYYRFARERETHDSYCSISPALMTPGLKALLARAPKVVPQSDVFRLILAAAFRLQTLHGVVASQLIHQVGLCLFHDYLHASRNAERRITRIRPSAPSWTISTIISERRSAWRTRTKPPGSPVTR